jgi:acetyl esterase/lipase
LRTLPAGSRLVDVTQQKGPHELPFVLEVPATGTVTRQDDFDIYRPDGGDQPLPAVVFVPGPMPAEFPARPRTWPVYQGYGRLMVSRAVIAVVLDLPYHAVNQWPQATEALGSVIESVRALEAVDADRMAVWAFSGGGLLVGRWLAQSPQWLRCLALTYPMLAMPSDPAEQAVAIQPGLPLVLTKVGRESASIQATVDEFLSVAARAGTVVDIVEVPDGQHGFDLLDHTEASRRAVVEAADLVIDHLLR